MTSNDDFGPFSDLRSPELIWDIRKLVLAADFPVYALGNELLGFRLHNIHVTGRGTSRQDVRLAQISLGYIFPSYEEYDQAISVDSGSKSEDSFAFSLDLQTAILNMQGFRPKGARSPSTLSALWKRPPWTDEDVVHQQEAVSQITWQSFDTSGLHFNFFNEDEPGRFSVAYSDAERETVIVVSIGAPRSRFLTILESLVELQGNASLVDKVQSDLKTAREELKRIVLEQRGLKAPRWQEYDA